MSLSRILILGAAMLATSCTGAPILPEHPGIVASMEQYYRRHGIEGNGRCLLPEMTVQKAEIVEQKGDRMVVEASYHWTDRRRGDGVVQDCRGFNSRRFTLYQRQVLAMSGEQR
jgi:hypothetical protein